MLPVLVCALESAATRLEDKSLHLDAFALAELPCPLLPFEQPTFVDHHSESRLFAILCFDASAPAELPGSLLPFEQPTIVSHPFDSDLCANWCFVWRRTVDTCFSCLRRLDTYNCCLHQVIRRLENAPRLTLKHKCSAGKSLLPR